MRALVLLVFVMLSVGAAVAQDNAPTPTTGETNGTAGEDGGATNATEGEDAPAEPAAPDCIASVTLIGRENLRWYLPDGSAPNPPLSVCASAPVTFTLTTEGGVPHNFLVRAEGAPPVTDIFGEGETVTYTWETPESGSFTYICQLHGVAMSGTVNVGAAAAPSGGGASGEGEDAVTGPTVALKQVAPEAPCDRAIPAIVTRDVVGGPVVQDYVEGCTRTEEVQAPPAHPVDLVIPISFLLIGVGVVAMVWVHKSYKP